MAPTADQLPDNPDTLKAMVLAREVENARLRQIIKELQRHRFGRTAETVARQSGREVRDNLDENLVSRRV